MNGKISLEKSADAHLARNTAIVQALPDLMFVIDLEGRYKEIYAPDDRLLPISRDNIIGKTLSDVFGKDEAERHLDVYRICIEYGNLQTLEYELDVHGKKRQFEARITRLNKDSILAIVRDITERKLAEEKIEKINEELSVAMEEMEALNEELIASNKELQITEDALRENEMRYRIIFEHTGSSMILIEDDMTISMANSEFVRYTGYSFAEIIGRIKWNDMVHPDDLKMMVEQHRLRRENQEGVLRDYDFRYITKSGEMRNALINISLIPGTRKSIASLIDITERKKAQDALLKSEEKYRSIMNNITDGYYEVDLRGNLTFCNPAFARMLRYSEAEIFGMNYRLAMNEETTKMTFIKFNDVFRTEIPIELFNLEFIRKDGSLLIADSGIYLLYNEQREKIGFWGLCRDITERKFAENKIKSLLEEKELLLKEVYHRTKNNMSTMMSILSLQSVRMKDPTSISALNDAANRMQSMAVLFDKLYRSESTIGISIKEYFSSLIDEIISNFPNSKMVKIEKNIDDFILDPKKMQPLGIILNELLTNIMKYAFTDRDCGLITVSAKAAGDIVSFIIQDNGNGMPESIDFKNTTGFGLMLVGMLTKQLSGTIRIERGNGTKIILEFYL